VPEPTGSTQRRLDLARAAMTKFPLDEDVSCLLTCHLMYTDPLSERSAATGMKRLEASASRYDRSMTKSPPVGAEARSMRVLAMSPLDSLSHSGHLFKKRGRK
jgi:hypothetical protein